MALAGRSTRSFTFGMTAVAGMFSEILAAVVGMLFAMGTAVGVFDETGASFVSACGLSHDYLQSIPYSLATPGALL